MDTTHELPKKFRASGSTCGIKDSGQPDLALFISDTPAAAAGVFTTNRVIGAPVDVSRSRVPAESIRAVVINSGNANACTGEDGRQAALTMTADVASALRCNPEQVLVCSTGIIGVPLPIGAITAGLPKAITGSQADRQSFRDAAVAMMTTDTFPKLASSDVVTATGKIRVSGAGKGAAMIAPNMATMLAVIMTDASLNSAQCDAILRYAVDRSFNCISVDGHMSTSDTVLLLANGASESPVKTGSDEAAVRVAVAEVCQQLATDIIRDAEGAGHFITVDVFGFDTRRTAFQVAKEVAESVLVKTAITGNDPNWGRITSAAGYAGVEFDSDYLSLTINGTPVYRFGSPVPFDVTALSQKMQQEEVHLLLELSGGPRSGNHSVRFWTSDLTQDYVRLNSDYTT
ncbi:MAG: bifunctional glutamate N-acetyltransferase/amino-acid acetyltransferase ArgJ [Fuerstiella sp.]|nr:bifunctional glutamate N-acetyltransferase/amino-acid acetyltransferase ArgJ [Fuerstiella sp.]